MLPPFFWYMKRILYCFLILAYLLFPDRVSADITVSGSAEVNKEVRFENFDHRPRILREYLQKHKSPLSDYAVKMVFYADLYEIDWRLVPAISGVESTFGKNLPKNSYNAYGWANGKYYFESWEDSIETVSRTLREKYYDRGATNIAKISRRYAPPSSTWGWKVKYFMNQIDSIPVEFDL